MLSVQNISKSFRQQRAVNGIRLELLEGEFYGLLGPNGAGKTTTIQMISGILPPDSGTILIGGKDVYAHTTEVKMLMGIVPQEIALYDDLSSLDNLLFWGGLYGIKGSHAKQKAAFLLEWVGLADRQNDTISAYSGGMKRRINIACALMHDPALILMDEPTVGIDPQSRNKIYELLQSLHQQNKTILYTTHYMEEAEKMCDRIGIIDHGKIIAEGTLPELKRDHDTGSSIVINYEGNVSMVLPGYEITNDTENKELIIHTRETRNILPDIVKKCSDAGITIHNIDIRNADLETIFLDLTGRQLRD